MNFTATGAKPIFVQELPAGKRVVFPWKAGGKNIPKRGGMMSGKQKKI